MTETWPNGLSYRPVSGSMTRAKPFRTPNRTDMEAGNVRGRRSATKRISTIKFDLKLSNAEFLVFDAFVWRTLVDGTLPFTMPIWTGAAYATRTCKFAEDPQDNPRDGFDHIVSLTLDVEDY
ncbi:hypothetical protein [Microbaculum marinum]|uniref:Uncharacterized protein n=1 Tax=Microbaculum marinum TaxID=1764581 RepID=A0AAW9RLU5_9HYPH